MKEGNLIWENKNVFQDFQHETTFKGKKIHLWYLQDSSIYSWPTDSVLWKKIIVKNYSISYL